MCTVCGCGSEEETHAHDHSHDHSHGHHHYGHGGAVLNVAGFSQNKLIEIEKNILSKNDGYAESNRRWLNQHGLAALNLLSSPGAG